MRRWLDHGGKTFFEQAAEDVDVQRVEFILKNKPGYVWDRVQYKTDAKKKERDIKVELALRKQLEDARKAQ